MKKIIATLFLILVGGIGFVVWRSSERATAVKRARSDANAICNAIVIYRDEYGSLPDANRGVFKVLRGDNPRQIKFLSPLDPDHWPKDEWLDPWGRQYIYDLSRADDPRVCSLGPDGRKSGDDIGNDQLARKEKP